MTRGIFRFSTEIAPWKKVKSFNFQASSLLKRPVCRRCIVGSVVPCAGVSTVADMSVSTAGGNSSVGKRRWVFLLVDGQPVCWRAAWGWGSEESRAAEWWACFSGLAGAQEGAGLFCPLLTRPLFTGNIPGSLFCFQPNSPTYCPVPPQPLKSTRLQICSVINETVVSSDLREKRFIFKTALAYTFIRCYVHPFYSYIMCLTACQKSPPVVVTLVRHFYSCI